MSDSSTDIRLRQLERRADDTAESLRMGNERFAEDKAKRTWFVLGLIGSLIAGALATGRILQRVDDTAETVEDHESTIREVETAVTEVKVQQVRLRDSVDGLKESIDTALERGKPKTDPFGRRKPR